MPACLEFAAETAAGLCRRRGEQELIDAAIHFTWSDPRDSQALYAAAIRDLMADFLGSIRDPAHAPRVRARDGVAALKLAAQASELAARTNP